MNDCGFEFVAGFSGKMTITAFNDDATDTTPATVKDLIGSQAFISWIDVNGVSQTRQMTIPAPTSDGIAFYDFSDIEIMPYRMEVDFYLLDNNNVAIPGSCAITIPVRTPKATNPI